jgi:penicillin-binding protein 1A
MAIQKGKYLKAILWIWAGFGGFLLMTFLYFLAVNYNFLGLFGEIPSFKDLENPKNELATEIYSADGVLMGKYYRENRTPVSYEEISPYLINALVATEDIRFEEHSGIDLIALMRVVASFGGGGGGSTLTQQLAKNLFSMRKKESEGILYGVPLVKTLIVKTKEWITAVRLERSYTKKEILEMYLNTVEFGHNAFGIYTASKTFFNKHPSQLNVQESAVLVGLLKAPTAFNPISNPKRSKDRRNTVLEQMEKYNFITSAQCEFFKKTPIEIRRGTEDHESGIAPYFRAELQKWLVKWGKENKRDPYKEGLRIHTTIDSKMQRLAEEALKEHLNDKQQVFFNYWKMLGRNPWVDDNGLEKKDFIEREARKSERYMKLVEAYGNDKERINKVMNTPVKMRIYTLKGDKDTTMTPMDSIRYYKHFLQAGFMVMEPQTGYIRAWVGGQDFKHFKYDHVYLGKRQPGSTFKPIIYAMALDHGYTACSQIKDEPVTFQGGWTPKNSNGGWTGAMMTLRQGIATSTNSIVARLIYNLGTKATIKFARDLGIESPLDESATICLGTSDVSILELTSVYATFANRGRRATPLFVSRIEDREGNTIADFYPTTKQVVSEDLAYQMNYMMMGSLSEPGGTSVALNNYTSSNGEPIVKGNEIAAKTGTTQLNADAWFMGYTRNLAAGVWVGGDTKHTRFLDIGNGQGAVLALPLWGRFFSKLYSDPELKQRYPKGSFEKPEDIEVELDCRKMAKKREEDLRKGTNDE